MYRVKQFETDVNLAAFSHWLQQQGIGNRITLEGDQQVLWLDNPDYAEPVLEALNQYLAAPQSQRSGGSSGGQPVYRGGRWQPSPSHAPLVLAIIVIAVLAAWATGLGSSMLSTALMVVDPRVYGWATFADRLAALSDTLMAGQVWRLFTPDFLHFSWPHIIFNSVMLWFLGSQIEWFDGRGRVVMLLVITSLASNGLQYLVSGPLFGGLSGVVYGILGYCWLSQRRLPRFQFPPALITVAVVWMAIGFTPLPEWLGIGRMANEAHLGGFLSGLAVAALAPPKRRTRR